MACINPNDPEFKKILKQVGGNPLLAAIEFNKLYPEEGTVESEVIKPGVPELFESNPELANAVYEALGFKSLNLVGENLFNTPILFDLNKIKSPSGKLGEQGATSEGIRELLKYVGVDLTNVNTNSTKAMADYLRSNPFERKKVLDLVKKEPIKLSQLPDGSYNLKDGNHRATILYYSGIESIPAIVTDNTNAPKIKEEYTGPFGGVTSPTQEIITPQQKQQALQLYSQYLDIIFPDSKVKDIVYHGSKTTLKVYNGKVIDHRYILSEPDEKGAQKMLKSLSEEEFNNLPNAKFETFRKKEHRQGGLDKFLGSGNYFTTSLKDAQKYAQTNLYSAIINVKNAYTENKGYRNSRSGKGSQELIDQGYDAVTEKINNGQEYNVFEPEQIHILGSKKDVEGFKEFVDKSTFKQLELDPEMSNYIADQISKAFNVPIPGMEKDTLITAEEIENFNRDVENRDGRLPSEYFTGIDDVNKWVLNKSELYDLVDKDTGEIYLKDVNLSTGQVEKQDKPSQPVPDKERQEAIDYLNNAVKDFRIDEILAERGYDVNDIISNLASAENKEEFDKIINKLLRLLC